MKKNISIILMLSFIALQVQAGSKNFNRIVKAIKKGYTLKVYSPSNELNKTTKKAVKTGWVLDTVSATSSTWKDTTDKYDFFYKGKALDFSIFYSDYESNKAQTKMVANSFISYSPYSFFEDGENNSPLEQYFPAKGDEYTWDKSAKKWVLSGSMTSTTDASGRVTKFEEEKINGSNKDVINRLTIVYDGKLIKSVLIEGWDSSKGKLNTILGIKKTYTKNGTGQPITAKTEITDTSGVYTEFSNTKFYYTSSKLSSQVNTLEFSGMVISQDSIVDIVWQDFDENKAEIFNVGNGDIEYGGDRYKSFTKYTKGLMQTKYALSENETKTYNTSLQLTNRLFEEYNSSNSKFENKEKSDYTYYANGDIKELKESMWDGSAWQVNSLEEDINTYDSDNDALTLYKKSTIFGTTRYEPKTEVQYNSFTDIEENVKSNVAVRFISIQNAWQMISLNENNQLHSYVVYDVNGKEITKGQLLPNQMIDNSTLNSGIYMVMLNDGNQTKGFKVVK